VWLALIAQLVGLQNRINTFLLRRFDERTRINNHDIRFTRFVGDLDPVLEQRAEHDFGIDEIFRATKRNQPDANRLGIGRLDAFDFVFRLHGRLPTYASFAVNLMENDTLWSADILIINMLAEVFVSPALLRRARQQAMNEAI
jgi:hypothetical protein